MNNAEIMPNRAQRIRTLYDDWKTASEGLQQAAKVWIEVTLNLAKEFHEARQELSSNQAFAKWLAVNALDNIGHQDRAAFIKMGENLELTRIALEETNRKSIQLIWRKEIEPRLRKGTKTDTNSPINQQHLTSFSRMSHIPAIQNAVEATSTVPTDSDQIENATVTKKQEKRRSKTQSAHTCVNSQGENPAKTAWLTKCRYSNGPHPRPKNPEATYQIISGKKDRLWDLIVESITKGAFGAPTADHLLITSLRLVLPWVPMIYANRFNLTRLPDVVLIRDKIIPVVLTNREILRTKPDQLAQLLGNAESKMVSVNNDKPESAKEQEVKMFGKTFWPNEFTSYTYDELCAAIWFFEFTRRQFPLEWRPTVIAIQMRQLLKWIYGKNRGWAESVTAICIAFEKNPEGECKIPLIPTNDGIE